jgi:hypothetical protein
MPDSTAQPAECLCGRLATRAHCPNCGGYQTYAYANPQLITRPGGKRVKLKAFRCLVCGEMFNEDDWQLRCHAPQWRPRGRPRKLIVRVDTPEERAELLERLREIQKLRDLSK